MNLCQQRSIQHNFADVKFDNVSLESLQRLSTHYRECNNRLVMVISHSASEDFLLGLLLFHFSSIPITMFTSFKNPILKKFAQSMGMLVHDKSQNTSNSQRIIDHLVMKKEFGLLIALGPTRPNERVHSGYFHIARTLQVPIVVIGFDYFLKSTFVSQKRWLPYLGESYDHFHQTSEIEILDDIQQICPLKPNLQPGFNPDYYPHGKLIGVTPRCESMFQLFAALTRANMATSYSLRHTVLLVAFCIALFLVFLCFLASLRYQMKTK